MLSDRVPRIMRATAVVIAVVIALVVAACGGSSGKPATSPGPTPSSSSASPADPGQTPVTIGPTPTIPAGAPLQVAPGVSVALPEGTDPSSYQLATGPPSKAATQSLVNSALQPLAGPLDFTSAKPVPAGTLVQWQLARNLTGPVFDAYYNVATGKWVGEPTSYDPATGVATATVAHFSVRGMFTWATDRVKALLVGAWKNVFGKVQNARGQASPPNCGNVNGVGMIITGKGNAVLSCHDATVKVSTTSTEPGVADIRLKLVNNRSYPIDVVYPSSASLVADDPGSLLQNLGALLTSAASHTNGESRALLPAGASATLVIPGVKAPFTGVTVKTQFDGSAMMMGILDTAIHELALVCGESEAVMMKEVMDTLDTSSLLHRVTHELADADLSLASIQTLSDIGMDALQIAFQKSKTLLVAAIAGVVVGLSDAVAQIVWGFFDNLRGQTYYVFTFRAFGDTWKPPPPLAAYAGSWYGHGRGLLIRPDGSGEVTYREYNWCPGSVEGDTYYDPTKACDSVTHENGASIIHPGGHVVFQIVGTPQGNTAQAKTLSATDPEWRSGFTITWVHDAAPNRDAMELNLPNYAYNPWNFCDAGSQPGICGA